MLVVKKMYSQGRIARMASRVFDDVVKRTDIPINYERLEFAFGSSRTSIGENSVQLGIDFYPIAEDHDKRTLATLIRFELLRPVVRKMIGRSVLRVIEDVLISREMIRNGYADDMAYVFYIMLHRQKVKNFGDYTSANIPWLIFHGWDEFYSWFFRELAKKKGDSKYELSAKDMFDALKKDLWDEKNLETAEKIWRRIYADH